MNKAILVLNEMPSCCIECPCRTKNLLDKDVCNCLYENNELGLHDLMHDRPYWCPLKEVPMGIDAYVPESVDYLSYHRGWYDCKREITGD